MQDRLIRKDTGIAALFFQFPFVNVDEVSMPGKKGCGLMSFKETRSQHLH